MLRTERRPDSEVWREARWQEDGVFSCGCSGGHWCHGEPELAGSCWRRVKLGPVLFVFFLKKKLLPKIDFYWFSKGREREKYWCESERTWNLLVYGMMLQPTEAPGQGWLLIALPFTLEDGPVGTKWTEHIIPTRKKLEAVQISINGENKRCLVQRNAPQWQKGTGNCYLSGVGESRLHAEWKEPYLGARLWCDSTYTRLENWHIYWVVEKQGH